MGDDYGIVDMKQKQYTILLALINLAKSIGPAGEELGFMAECVFPEFFPAPEDK